jgi:hypothetical protein
MQRYELINSLALLNKATTYLEVGVEAGVTFSNVNILDKTAVDPIFRFDTKNSVGNFFEMTSDDFFHHAITNGSKFDFIFLDGLHQWEFALRDFINATLLSHKKTIVVIDDVLPTDFFSQLRSQSDCVKFKNNFNHKDKNWMGDVYKILPLIDLLFTQWTFWTLKINHGQTILFQNPRKAPLLVDPNLSSSFEDILYDKIPYNFSSFDDLYSNLISLLKD